MPAAARNGAGKAAGHGSALGSPGRPASRHAPGAAAGSGLGGRARRATRCRRHGSRACSTRAGRPGCPRTPQTLPAARRAPGRPAAALPPASGPIPCPWRRRPSQEPVCTSRSTAKSRPPTPCVPTTTPSRITASSSVQSEGFHEAQRDQWYCSVLRARSSGDASVQATMNGCTLGSCTPAAASSASASRSSRLGQRSSSAGVCSRRWVIGHREDTMAAIVPRPGPAGHLHYAGRLSSAASSRPALSPRNGAPAGRARSDSITVGPGSDAAIGRPCDGRPGRGQQVIVAAVGRVPRHC